MAAAMQANDPRLPPDANFVGKFAFDVILFNLHACGYERRFLVLNSPKSGYSNPNFVRIAAVSVLRLCLTYRDKWKQNIEQLTKNVSVYDATFFGKCLCHIVERAQKEGKEALQLNVEITLALSTEMALYLISKDRPFDLMALVGAATSNIFCLIETPVERTFKLMFCPNSPPVNFKQELEKLFNEFENIWELLGWIVEFMRRYACPYGEREDVSAIFYREVGRRWKDIVERVHRGEKPPVEIVIINLGFLPKEAYDNIKAETSVPMPKYSEVAWGRNPAKPSASSEGGKKSGRRQSTASGSSSKQTAQASSSGKDSSKQTSKGGQSSKDSSKQASQGGKDSSKQTAQSGKKKKRSSKQATQDVQSSKDSSEQTAQGGQSGKDSSEQPVQGAQSSKDSSEQSAQGAQSSKDSSDPELVEAISRIDLGSEAKSQASQGAITKRKSSKK